MILTFIFVTDANDFEYPGHATNDIVSYQSPGWIRDLTASERNVFGLERNADQQAVSIFCLFPQICLPESQFIPKSLHGSSSLTLLPFSSPSLPLSPSLTSHLATSFSFLPSFTSLLFHQVFIHPHYSSPSLGKQAGFPTGSPDGALASQLALGLCACRMAGRPFCGRYGGGQSWHLSVTMEQQGDGKAGTQKEHCQYTADWGTNCGWTH